MTGRHEIVIVGAGVAGAATAFSLTRRGLRDIIILEKARTPGTHSSGRNAAILRTLMPDPVLRRIAREAAGFYRKPPAGFCAHDLIDPVGIFLVARQEYAHDLLSCLGNGNEEHAPSRTDPVTLYRQIPWVAPGLTAVLFQSDEGLLDIHAILQSFLQGACRSGAELRTSCEATSLRVCNGVVVGIDTSAGHVPAAKVILAGGGWVADLAARAGFPLPLIPYRRHLLVTEPLQEVDPRWPVVWILGDEFYFRPESGGLLMCGCDTVPVAADQGEITDQAEVERIAAKAARWLPRLAHARVARAWSGMRTFAPDHRFVIGADPRLRGLYWAAALGGHGMTCAPIVGDLAAEAVVSGMSEHAAASALAPDRLLR